MAKPHEYAQSILVSVAKILNMPEEEAYVYIDELKEVDNILYNVLSDHEGRVD